MNLYHIKHSLEQKIKQSKENTVKDMPSLQKIMSSNSCKKEEGFVSCRELFDRDGNRVFTQHDSGSWTMYHFEPDNDIFVYYEDSDGVITDHRKKEVTMQEVEAMFGCKVKIKK